MAKSQAFGSLYPEGMRILQDQRAKSGAGCHSMHSNFVRLQPVSLVLVISFLQSSLVSCNDCVDSDKMSGGYPAPP
eukprot:12535778-Heterocapsa_arctica.AAC.1